jgi:hypothetical protein
MEAALRRYQVPIVVSLLVLIMTGCASVKLIADYDEQTDMAVTQFQRKMETFLFALERNMGKNEASYGSNAKFYDEVRVDLSAIRVRAAAIPENNISLQQLSLLADNVSNLEKLHKLGLSANDIPPARNAFNVACTAILKLEIAKKRGK